MISVEISYSAFERESVRIIFALRKFRLYILSDQKFKVVTRHKSLQYAFKKRDVHGRISRWMDFLVEYEINFMHIQG